MKGKQRIIIQEMVGKIKVALDDQVNSGFHYREEARGRKMQVSFSSKSQRYSLFLL
jgi:hypothetical protein